MAKAIRLVNSLADSKANAKQIIETIALAFDREFKDGWNAHESFQKLSPKVEKPQEAGNEPPEEEDFDMKTCCRKCNPKFPGMMLCSSCGNKRCPHATDHNLSCTRSNKPGQAGSYYEDCVIP